MMKNAMFFYYLLKEYTGGKYEMQAVAVFASFTGGYPYFGDGVRGFRILHHRQCCAGARWGYVSSAAKRWGASTC
jgi:hypothetical protein